MAQKHTSAAEQPAFEGGSRLRLACIDGVPLTAYAERDDAHKAESPEEIFDALDGAEIWKAGRDWHLEVFSVLIERTVAWVQLRVSGDSEHTLTLKLPRHEAAAEALTILSTWLIDRAESPHVLNVS
jgi:hypothetical protein